MFSANAPPRNCSSSLTESACPPDEFAPSTRLRLGADTIAGLLIDVNHSTLGPITLPAPLRFFDPDGTEVTRTPHLPPRVLGADTDTVSGRLRQGAVR